MVPPSLLTAAGCVHPTGDFEPSFALFLPLKTVNSYGVCAILDQQTEKMLMEMSKAGAVALHDLTVEEAREAWSEIGAAYGCKTDQTVTSEDRDIPGPNGTITIRLYWPQAGMPDQPIPFVVYYHGGGFVLGDIDSHDSLARYMCEKSGVVVVSVNYRLAPENLFPVGLEDCYTALVWARENAGDIGGDCDRIAVAGDSAGGNLAATVCHMVRDRNGPGIKLQLLIYPWVDMTVDAVYLSYDKFGGGEYFLSLADLEWTRDLYFAENKEAKDMRASPLLYPDFSNLPPALIITAGYDPLRDQGKDYADKLSKTGVKAEYQCFAGAIHGFLSFAGLLNIGVSGLDRLVRAIKKYL